MKEIYITFTLISSYIRCEFYKNCKTNAKTGIFRRIYATLKRRKNTEWLLSFKRIFHKKKLQRLRRWRKIPWTVSNKCNLSSVYDSIWIFLMEWDTFFSITLSLGRDCYHKNQSRKQTASGASREKFYIYIYRRFDGFFSPKILVLFNQFQFVFHISYLNCKNISKSLKFFGMIILMILYKIYCEEMVDIFTYYLDLFAVSNKLDNLCLLSRRIVYSIAHLCIIHRQVRYLTNRNS